MSLEQFNPKQTPQDSLIGRGIYRLYNGDEVVYVGQAQCITVRVAFHHCEGAKQFTHYDYLLVPADEERSLNAVEAEYIFLHKPRYNYAIPRTGRYRRLHQIAHSLRKRVKDVASIIEEQNLPSFLGLYDEEQVREALNVQG